MQKDATRHARLPPPRVSLPLAPSSAEAAHPVDESCVAHVRCLSLPSCCPLVVLALRPRTRGKGHGLAQHEPATNLGMVRQPAAPACAAATPPTTVGWAAIEPKLRSRSNGEIAASSIAWPSRRANTMETKDWAIPTVGSAEPIEFHSV
ncbi:hypothetical protein CDD83_4698 [Cordyceps sp. RAO-2017]|nr:hypothetical protein CDD83_4698 [Cordyceps sp. RAO-2017]